MSLVNLYEDIRSIKAIIAWVKRGFKRKPKYKPKYMKKDKKGIWRWRKD